MEKKWKNIPLVLKGDTRGLLRRALLLLTLHASLLRLQMRSPGRASRCSSSPQAMLPAEQSRAGAGGAQPTAPQMCQEGPGAAPRLTPRCWRPPARARSRHLEAASPLTCCQFCHPASRPSGCCSQTVPEAYPRVQDLVNKSINIYVSELTPVLLAGSRGGGNENNPGPKCIKGA